MTQNATKKKYKNPNTCLARHIIVRAIVSPYEQILTNAGIDPDSVKVSIKKNHGFDVKNEKYGDMFKMGVIDPLKVTKIAFINAVIKSDT